MEIKSAFSFVAFFFKSTKLIFVIFLKYPIGVLFITGKIDFSAKDLYI